ncbi:uncharacterized protein LOC113234618 [Hyposmocoma kahamanoa]|uniref:uncharacterized protein LOC113234618 n=1 Tax=Hyposmocoma kahamanoa TaxID=1477025 RepID=UPI000E6D98E0|nr:uncharacterized protein LOC113234618 [Hyposmocoma kahamanoa]XP_026325757.1 uncharacterized protein LOC113234618 [Hyposmocoma kahamanoa]
MEVKQASNRQDAATITKVSCDSEKYRRCSLLNIIQHIDIWGRYGTSYTDKNRLRVSKPAVTCSSISCTSRMFDSCSQVKNAFENKLKKLSVTTKVSGLWPGHDILSKRKRSAYKSASPDSKRLLNKTNTVFSAIVPR